MITTVTRYHDISCGHRVPGHEGKCKNLHGHNYRIYFTCQAEDLDDLGRVVDFGVVKERLCMWLEKNWDHRMLIWLHDPWWCAIKALDPTTVCFPYIPTAENIAGYLVEQVGPTQLAGTGITLVRVVVEETRKCSAEVAI
jgi:6-pyruvoyltetrahydropterin/6-carboxytetrahydropterin synthase